LASSAGQTKYMTLILGSFHFFSTSIAISFTLIFLAIPRFKLNQFKYFKVYGQHGD
jgi:hypothetical protein